LRCDVIESSAIEWRRCACLYGTSPAGNCLHTNPVLRQSATFRSPREPVLDGMVLVQIDIARPSADIPIIGKPTVTTGNHSAPSQKIGVALDNAGSLRTRVNRGSDRANLPSSISAGRERAPRYTGRRRRRARFGLRCSRSHRMVIWVPQSRPAVRNAVGAFLPPQLAGRRDAQVDLRPTRRVPLHANVPCYQRERCRFC
jgi:hypothetical protein